MITAEDYTFLANLLSNTSGLELGPDKGYLLSARLEPLAGKLGLKGISELVSKLRQNSDFKLAEDVVEAMATQESFFFRDQVVYDKLQEVVLPQLLERRKNIQTLRIWSAACSRGQEPYSIAMMLALYPKELKGWMIQIMATDFSNSALEYAKAGLYSDLEAQRGLTKQLLNQFFSPRGEAWKINPETAQRVTFQRFNLLHPMAHLGTFDLVLCRNILIYLSTDNRKRVLEAMADTLASDGFLVLGSSENMIGISDIFSRIKESRMSIYQKKGNAK